MIKCLQAGALVAIYLWWIWLIRKRKLHLRWRIFYWYCIAALALNATLWWSLYRLWIEAGMTAFRMAPGIEAVFFLVRRERWWPAKGPLLVGAVLIEASTIAAAFGDLRWKAVSLRDILLSFEAGCMLFLALCDWRWPLDCDDADRFHLRMLTVWMWILAAASLLHPWYGSTMARWKAANAIYIVLLAAVVFCYRYVPTGPGGGCSAD